MQDVAAIGAIPDLDHWLAERDLNGSWQRARPQAQGFPSYPPFLWKWQDISEGLATMRRLAETHSSITPQPPAAILLTNPRERPGNPITTSLSVGSLMPAESAAPRHASHNLLRFVIQGGADATMTVDGESFPGELFPMEDGDLILIPASSSYEVTNHTENPVFWLDGLDAPLARLAHVFTHTASTAQHLTKPTGHSATILRGARPLWALGEPQTQPFRYPWADDEPTPSPRHSSSSHTPSPRRSSGSQTPSPRRSGERVGVKGALDLLRSPGGQEKPPDPCDGVILSYTHPVNAGPTTPTIEAQIQLLPPNQKLHTHRHNSTTRYHVVQGSGSTTVEGETLSWTARDVFVVPPWCWHTHRSESTEDAILFSITDRPFMTALEYYREEVQA